VQAPRTRRSPTRRRAVVVVAVVAALVVAGGLAVGFVTLHRQPGGGSPVVDDGPNFYQLLAMVNSSVVNVTGGPWSLFSVVGLAAQGDFSPNVRGYEIENQSLPVNSCQSLLAGTTLWNGTIPVTSGTLNSGTAPFWQLAYFSSVSQQLLIITSSSGTLQVFSPIPASSGCAYSWDPLPYNFTFWGSQIYSNSSLPVNSPVAAQVMWNNVGQYWFKQNEPAVEVLWLGAQVFTEIEGSPGGNWGVDYLRCGLAGLSGDQNLIDGGIYRDGEYGGALSATGNCAILNYPPDSGTYQIANSTPNVTAIGASHYVAIPDHLYLEEANGSVADFEPWGLANWMVSMNLTNASGQPLPAGTPTCLSWVSSIADCAANSSGWYVVLLSAGGLWLASYGATQSGIGWSVPVTAMVSHQQIVLVVPSTWDLTGDRLGLNSTVSYCTVTGSLTL
jgi:hypothetical protein